MELASLSRRFAQLPQGKRAAFLERLRAEGIGFDALPPIAREPGTPAPLAPAQRALWLAWQRAPQSPAYNLAGRLRIRGGCCADEVQAAVRRLVQRHAVLRTRIGLDADGQAVQIVDETEDVSTGSGWSVHGPCTDAAAHAFAARPFDLERGPVFRAALHREADGALVLLLGVHHIAADGGSVALLLQELSSLLRDPAQALEPPALQYADHAQWQQRWLAAGELARQRAWWVDELRDAPPTTTLPLDRPRGARRSARGELLAFGLPPATGDALLALARRDAASPAMLALALLALLLHRYGGDRELCIGVPSANRDRPELAGMVGHFTNVLVLRLRVDPQAGFAALLRQVRERLLAARQHAHLPLDQLVEALGIERSAGLNPLFQVKCASQATGGAAELAAGGGLQIEIDAVAVDEVHFDLSLDLVENARGLDFQLAWATDLFDRTTIDRLAAAFVHLAAQVAADPQRALASTTLPGTPSVLHGEAPSWPWHGIPALWAAQAERHAQQPALLDARGSHTHAQLKRAARQLAAQLARRGIGAEARVALLLERGSPFVLAMLAVMKAGAVAVPLDPSLPVPRLQALVRDCGARALMAAGPVPWSTLPVMVPGFEASGPSSLAPEPVLLPDQAAYLIYTSGSTGAPKGVLVSHGALANYAQAMLARLADADGLPLPAGLRFAMVSTVAADLGHTALFGALCSGGSLLMLDSAAAFDPDAFADAMARHRIDVLKIVPSHLKGLLNAARPHDVLPAHTLVLGGEAADAALLATVRALRPGLRIVNHYGPTETCVGMLMHVAGDGDAALPLGRPIGGMSAFVLDESLAPVQPGIAGELFVGGPGVARGYLGQPGLTASRFVASPFGDSSAGERLYRTGDRVRQRSDGALVFLGRNDDQLKIRGFRVEPGELHAQLRAMDGVADAAVVAGEGESGSAVLWAYVVARAGATLDAAAVRLALQASLPAPLVPEAVVVLDAMPLTPNGKIDRNALPRPQASAPARRIDPPRGPTEQALARLFGEVLGLGPDAVGRDDDFFELGGDSILSLKLIARIRKQVPGGAGLALSDLMQATRVSALAGRLQQRLAQQHDAICLHAGGTGVPLYCMPGMIVNSREFLPLAEALQGTRPVHGFVSHVYTRQRWRGFAVEALAAEYAAFIEATAAQRRCALLGWSSGGDLAIEVARQLQGRVAVEFIGMVDVFETEPLRASRPLGVDERALAWREIDAWVAKSTMAEAWRELFARLEDAERDGLAEQVLAGDRTLPLDGDGDDAAEYLLWATVDKRAQGARQVHGRLDTPLHVFQAAASVNDSVGRLRDWAEHAPVAATGVIDGASHLDIIRRPQLHAALREALEKLDG